MQKRIERGVKFGKAADQRPTLRATALLVYLTLRLIESSSSANRVPALRTSSGGKQEGHPLNEGNGKWNLVENLNAISCKGL